MLGLPSFSKIRTNLKSVYNLYINFFDKMGDNMEPRLIYKKKKVALLLAYSGINYYGMQINKEVPTIEQELIKALVQSSSIPLEHGIDMFKMKFQRAARTDKNVSALGQMRVMSNTVDSINAHLPPTIKVLDIIRVTQGFNSKISCSSRTYEYLMPTYGFVPAELVNNLDPYWYRIEEKTLASVRRCFSLYKGSHNFHNFTSGKSHSDRSSIRYIMETEVSEPFMQQDIEFVKITIKGQSFMLHQIRKMIGLVMAATRQLIEEEDIYKTWLPEKTNVPKAPGLGLVLREVHYDWYNKKFKDDTSKDSLTFDKYKEVISEFANKYVYEHIIKTEKEQKIIYDWSKEMLPFHYQRLANSKTDILETMLEENGVPINKDYVTDGTIVNFDTQPTTEVNSNRCEA